LGLISLPKCGYSNGMSSSLHTQSHYLHRVYPIESYINIFSQKITFLKQSASTESRAGAVPNKPLNKRFILSCRFNYPVVKKEIFPEQDFIVVYLSNKKKINSQVYRDLPTQ